MCIGEEKNYNVEITNTVKKNGLGPKHLFPKAARAANLPEKGTPCERAPGCLGPGSLVAIQTTLLNATVND